LTHSGRLTHEVVTRQPWIRRRSGKVRQLRTDVLTTEPRRHWRRWFYTALKIITITTTIIITIIIIIKRQFIRRSNMAIESLQYALLRPYTVKHTDGNCAVNSSFSNAKARLVH